MFINAICMVWYIVRGFVVAPELESRIAGMMDISNKGAVLPGTCSECHAPGETRMCLTDIPFFKEIVIMCVFPLRPYVGSKSSNHSLD
jgi:hypothetical protein